MSKTNFTYKGHQVRIELDRRSLSAGKLNTRSFVRIDGKIRDLATTRIAATLAQEIIDGESN